MSDPGLSPTSAAASIAAEWLTPPERLAIAYAPRALRGAWLGLLALDRRLGDAARVAREPIMIQLRLAWWRDHLAEPASARPRGEPLLALLARWDGERATLVGLVDGWEARIVGEDGGRALDHARAEAILALTRIAGLPQTPAIAVAANAWAQGQALPSAGLPRALRPLVLLDHFDRAGPSANWRVMVGAMRKAWFG